MQQQVEDGKEDRIKDGKADSESKPWSLKSLTGLNHEDDGW
jgi:hypothetical protein